MITLYTVFNNEICAGNRVGHSMEYGIRATSLHEWNGLVKCMVFGILRTINAIKFLSCPSFNNGHQSHSTTEVLRSVLL